MNFDFLNEISKTIENVKENINLSKFVGGDIVSENELELAQKLNAIEEFSIDRFEDDIAILENRITGEKKDIEKSKLPNEVKEGSIVKCINGKYIYDEELRKHKTRNEWFMGIVNLWGAKDEEN